MRANRGRSAANARRLVGALVAALLLLGVAPAVADTKSDLANARARLSQLEQDIQAQEAHLADIRQQVADQHAKLTVLQGELNALATKIDLAQNALDATKGQVAETQAALRATRARYESLRDRLDERARVSYEMGPASSLGLILGSTTVGELSDRLVFVDQLSSLDSVLADEVENRANELQAQRLQLEEIKARQDAALGDLSDQKDALDGKFVDVQAIYDDLASKAADAAQTADSLRANAAEADSIVSTLEKKLKAEELAAAREAARKAREAARKAKQEQQQQQGGGGSGGGDGGGSGGGGDGGGGGGTVAGTPFSVCPVDQPRAYGDSFGAPRYAGGYHPHAGNDIMAPEGTPIRATFDGVATDASNGLGGNSVIVTGAEGYTYNAHLSAYGTLGSVSAGTVIGYVGNTGDAQGGPTHDHFEWHPNVIPADPYRSPYGYTIIGSAIDPYPYLNMVC